MSARHLHRARQASLDRRLRWCDLISLSSLPGALVSLAFPIYSARWPESVDDALSYCLAVNALWPLLVVELVWRRQVRMRVESLSGGSRTW